MRADIFLNEETGAFQFCEINTDGSAGINATVAFFREIGMPVSLSDLGLDPTEDDINALSLNATKNGTVKLSRIHPLTLAEVETIFRMAR